MSNNENFVATMSTDELYFGQDLLLCATDVIQGKADLNHDHNDIYVINDNVATISEVETYLNI